MTESDPFSLESYDYELPEERIAQHPPEVRGTSRLMILDRSETLPKDSVFDRLPDFLPERALLVANNSRVVPARLFGKKPSGGKAEMLLLTPPGASWRSRPVPSPIILSAQKQRLCFVPEEASGRRCAGFRPFAGGSQGKTRFRQTCVAADLAGQSYGYS